MGHARWVALMMLLATVRVRAQTTNDLDRARALFAEALADQEAGRVPTALEKFRRVAEARDTAQVEYRIGSCLETLGQKRAALVAYDRAAHIGRGEANAQDVVASANDHITALATHMGKVHVVVRGAADVAVAIDGTRVADDELASSVTLEPGEHTIEVTAPGAHTAHASITIEQGQRRELAIDLDREPARTDAQIPVTTYARRNVGWVIGGVGIAFAIAAGVTLGAREGLIGSIESNCPNNLCPASLHDSIEGMRSEAMTLGPVAAAFAGIGGAAIVVGGVLVLLGPEHRTIAFAPTRDGGMLVLRGTF